MNSEELFKNVYERIVSALAKGVIPWRQPCRSGLPQNLFSRRPYGGVNFFLLGISGFASPYWATAPQVQKHGGRIKSDQGSKPTAVICSLPSSSCQSSGTEGSCPGRKRSHRFICHLVFNSEQTEGLERFLECSRTRIACKPLEFAELIVRNMPNPPLIRNIPLGPSYCPVKDEVYLPPLGHFLSAEEYYCTLFHELVHSTAQPERLGRGNWISTLFSESEYSQEELVAEMGAAMLCALAGIESQTLDNSAAYIGHWMEELDNDKRMLYFAAIHASRAFNFIARRQGSCLAA